MKIKVAIVVDHLGSGGTQRQIIEYLKFANRDSFDIKVINLDKGNDLHVEDIKKIGYEIFNIRHSGFFNLSTLAQLVKIFKQIKPDIVQTYLFTADCYGRLAAKLAGVKIIMSSVRNLDIWQKWHHNLADWILAAFTDKITVNARIIENYLVRGKKISPYKVLTIYNGLDLERFEKLSDKNTLKTQLGIPLNALVIGMVARFSEQKDYETYLAVARNIIKTNPNVCFLAVGDGKLKSKYETENKEFKNNIIFTGLRKDTPDLINLMDICVLSSKYEGCPNVILEYMACAKPVIASNVGGCSELILEGKTGFIVEQGNKLQLEEKIIGLINNEGKRIDFGKEGRKRIEENFTSQTLAQKTEKLYLKLTSPKIAFIFSQFPAYDETFILREMNQLNKTGLNFIIYSIKKCRDKIIHEDTKALAQTTKYMGFFSLKLLAINAYFILRHPFRYLSAFLNVFFRNIPSREFFLKTIFAWFQMAGFAWQARKDRITQVHGQWATYPATFAYVISKLNKIPFSFTGHAHDIYVDTTMLAFKMKKAKFITTCTANNKKHLLELAKQGNLENKIIINYHGVDINKFNVTNEKNNAKFTILSVGSLLECKGFDILIKSCKILKNQNANFECIIAGGGKLEKELKNLASNLGLEKDIKFTGYITQDKLIPLYKQADIFALPVKLKIHWGIPNVLLEAMASRLPVITTSLPSIPELINDNANGFIIPENNPEILAEKIILLANNKNLCKQFAELGFKMVEDKFSIEKNAQNLNSIFSN